MLGDLAFAKSEDVDNGLSSVVRTGRKFGVHHNQVPFRDDLNHIERGSGMSLEESAKC